MENEHSPMTSQPSAQIRPSTRDWGMKLKTFLTAVMSLLSILVVGLGGFQKDVFWLWIGFVCCLVSGVFVQLFINRIKNDVASGRR
jgi:1,4-dihydroxy-2-naphthoate octaprenyltransferase